MKEFNSCADCVDGLLHEVDGEVRHTDLPGQAQRLQVEGVIETRTEHAQGFLEHMFRHVAGVGLRNATH